MEQVAYTSVLTLFHLPGRNEPVYVSGDQRQPSQMGLRLMEGGQQCRRKRVRRPKKRA